MSEPAAASAPKKSNMLLVVVALVAVGGGAAAGAFWYGRHGAPPTEAAALQKPRERGIVSFEPFVVNLADAGGSRFLRATVQLVVPDTEAAERIQKTPVLVMQARSAILELLTQQTSEEVVKREGKAALKKAIGERTGDVLEGTKVVDVLFSDFVIQF